MIRSIAVPTIAATLCFVALSTVCAAAPPKADFVVAPNGNDANPGTADAPLATVHKARDCVRKLVAAGLKKDVTILIRGGTYFLEEPLVLGPQDSGTTEHAIRYQACPGEKVRLSGGRVIKGWTRQTGGKWTIDLPEVRSGSWRFRQLFADGQRLGRARFPNGDELLRVRSVSKDVKRIVVDQDPGVSNLAGKDAELVMIQNWSISRDPIVRSEGATLHVAVPMGWIGHGHATTASRNKPCWMENAPEFVDRPGEWYLDRKTGRLTLMSDEGENPNGKRFVAPRLDRLLCIEGTPDAPVRNVHFQGLTFEHVAWELPKIGYMGIQAGHHGSVLHKEPLYVLPPAIGMIHARGCGLERCCVRHTGASGIGVGIACRENTIIGCMLTDIGGNGIMIGWRGKGKTDVPNMIDKVTLSADWKDPADVPTGNQVSNCVLTDCAAVNFGCVGVYDAFCVGTRITHNWVKDMPYTGISIGFKWDTSPTTQRDCLVAYNHIHDCMQKLADGGGIYTLGLQPGTVLRGNHIHDIHRSQYAHGGAPNNGIFFDQGSKGFLVEGQIIYNAHGGAIRFNQTNKQNLSWKDNHFDVKPSDPKFPKEAAAKAGLESAYKDVPKLSCE